MAHSMILKQENGAQNSNSQMDAFSRALRQPSHWQLEIFSLVLIGCCDNFALVLQHSSKSTLLHYVIGSEN